MARYKYLAGYEFIGCAIRDCDRFGFAAVKPEIDDPLETNPHRIFAYHGERPAAKRWAYRGEFSATGMHLCAVTIPEPKWICVCDDGFVFSTGSGSEGEESKVAERCCISDLATIDGRAYACGTGGVYRRERAGTWRRLATGMPANASIQTLAGRSASDVYAHDGKRLWWWNGKRWVRQRVPGDFELDALCCGADGRLYALANRTWVVARSGATWTTIAVGASPECLAWFGDRLYVGTGDALLELAGTKLVPAKIGTPSKVSYIGHLAASHGLLLAAGGKHASYHDGSRWRSVV